MSASIRPLALHEEPWIHLVAQRMAETLDEVVGVDRAHHRYSPAWLQDRVRHHLDPTRCEGCVFLAFVPDHPAPVAHTIVRREGENGLQIGVFATTYVSAAHRRRGIAGDLLDHGEAWMHARGLTSVRTDTATGNTPLRTLFERRGYAVVQTAPDGSMVRLQRTLPRSGTPPTRA